MEIFKSVIPQDTTLLPGMKTIMADRSDKNSISYIKDVEYVRRGDIALKLQLLLPSGCQPELAQKEKRPLVVYVQGSAWAKQDCYRRIPMISDLAKKGYVVASVEYRPAEVSKFPGFLQDVKSAIRFLRAHAEEYGIDPEKVAIWGDSSGGHAALMVGTTGDMEEFKTEDNADMSDRVNVVIDFYGPTDVTQVNNTPRDPKYAADPRLKPEDVLFGGVVTQDPEIAQPGNPINYVSIDKELPPILIAHGDWDSMVPFNQSVLMYQKLVECKKAVEFYKVVGAEHGTFMWTSELMEIVGKFLGAYL